MKHKENKKKKKKKKIREKITSLFINVIIWVDCFSHQQETKKELKQPLVMNQL